MEIIEGADFYYQVVYYLGLGAFSVFVIQSIITIFGGDFSDGTQADFDGHLGDHSDGHFGVMQMFTFRNFINFLLGFSWTAIALHHHIENKVLLSSIAAIAGIALVAVVLGMMKQLQKLAQDKTMKIDSSIGKSATVYLTIPGNREGRGKVHVSIQETLRELDAMTDGEALPTNSAVVVVEVVQNSILLVKKI